MKNMELYNKSNQELKDMLDNLYRQIQYSDNYMELAAKIVMIELELEKRSNR